MLFGFNIFLFQYFKFTFVLSFRRFLRFLFCSYFLFSLQTNNQEFFWIFILMLDNFINNMLTKRKFELMIFVGCQKWSQGALKGNSNQKHHNNMFMRWFNHKNNHIFKPREYNRLKLQAMSLNNLLQQTYLFIKYMQTNRKERNHKYLQLVDF